jgi:AI-2 transport protein TqsA
VIGVVAIPGVLQIVIGNTVQPKLVGEGLDLHPVTIILSLAFWGLLWGPIGMVLAVPIMAVARIVLIRFETTAPLARLLAGELPGLHSFPYAPDATVDELPIPGPEEVDEVETVSRV